MSHKRKRRRQMHLQLVRSLILSQDNLWPPVAWLWRDLIDVDGRCGEFLLASIRD